MALKIWLNGSMHNISRFTGNRIFTFVGGVKKNVTKGITFINGEKKILWQQGEMIFNSWTLSELGYQNTVNIYSRIYGMDANENKVVFNVNEYVARTDVSNISVPVMDNSPVVYGAITYHKEGLVNGKSDFDANYYNFTNISYLSPNPAGTGSKSHSVDVSHLEVNIVPSTMVITSTTFENTYRYTASGQWVSNNYYENEINVGNGYGVCRIQPMSGYYTIYKNYTLSSPTTVTTITANGYSGSLKPLVFCMAIYNNRYLLFGAEYQASNGGNYVYSLKKVDLSNGVVATLIDNQPTPVTGIMTEGNMIIVTVDNKLLRIDIDGNILNTYSSPNIMPTLIGKYGDFYYVTTTREFNSRNYMNIEIIDENNFNTAEIKQLNIRMVETLSLPYKSENGFLCFGSKHYVVSSVYGSQTTASARTETIRAGHMGITWSEDEMRICRIQCY